MAENQEELNVPIGTEEAKKLEPKQVKIVEVRVEEVGNKGAKKVVCDVKHPDNENTIQISSIKYENKGKLASVGLWVNKDSENKLRKGSTLVYFLNTMGAKTIAELKDKDCATTTDEQGYLTFKAY